MKAALALNQRRNERRRGCTALDLAEQYSRVHVDVNAANAERRTVVVQLEVDMAVKPVHWKDVARLHPGRHNDARDVGRTNWQEVCWEFNWHLFSAESLVGVSLLAIQDSPHAGLNRAVVGPSIFGTLELFSDLFIAAIRWRQQSKATCVRRDWVGWGTHVDLIANMTRRKRQDLAAGSRLTDNRCVAGIGSRSDLLLLDRYGVALEVGMRVGAIEVVDQLVAAA